MIDLLSWLALHVVGVVAEPLNNRFRDGRPLLAKRAPRT